MKPVLAFVAGIVIASGVAFVVSSNHKSEPTPAAVTASAPVSPAPAPAVEQPPVSSAEPAKPQPAEVKPAPVSTPVARVEKKRPAPMQTAANRLPAQPAPASAPPPQTAPQTSTSAPVPAPAVREEPRPTPAPVEEAPRPAPAPVRVPQTVTIPAGTMLTVRLEEALSSDRSFQGDQFRGTLDQPLIIDHAVIAERGSRVLGRVAEIDKGGKVKGLAQLGIELTTINTSDGQKIQIHTERFTRTAEKDTKSDAAKVGIGAGLGAIIGAIAGGGKGAAIGAGVGGAAGAGDVMLTRGKAAQLPVESKVSFRLREPVTVTERLR